MTNVLMNVIAMATLPMSDEGRVVDSVTGRGEYTMRSNDICVR
jgi:hypothetical protein